MSLARKLVLIVMLGFATPSFAPSVVLVPVSWDLKSDGLYITTASETVIVSSITSGIALSLADVVAILPYCPIVTFGPSSGTTDPHTNYPLYGEIYDFKCTFY